MKPLADRMRPNNLNEIVGQQHLIGANGVIRKCLEQNKMYSSIFYVRGKTDVQYKFYNRGKRLFAGAGR